MALLDKHGQPYGTSWGGMSMGEGRKLEPYTDDQGCPSKFKGGTMFDGCPSSPDSLHHFTAVSCVQSVEHFVCDHCGKDEWD